MVMVPPQVVIALAGHWMLDKLAAHLVAGAIDTARAAIDVLAGA